MRISTASKTALIMSLLVAVLAAAPAAVLAAEPQFGIASFQLVSCANGSSENGLECKAPYSQAGGTPYELTTTFHFNLHKSVNINGAPVETSVEEAKDIKVSFPPGVVFNPQAITQCPIAVFTNSQGYACPPSSQVGTILTSPYGSLEQVPLYNLTPLAGRPAEFGFYNQFTFVITGGARTGEGYSLTGASSDIPEVEVTSASITTWGVPADPSHDPQRGQECTWLSGSPSKPAPGNPNCRNGGKSSGAPPVPFVRLPTECSGEPLAATIETDSWMNPGALDQNGNPLKGDPNWKIAEASPAMPPVEGCEKLTFSSSLTVQPDTAAAGEPVGLGVELAVPQSSSPEVLGTSDVKDVKVEMPEGMVISPSAAQGLGVCNNDQGADPNKTPNEFGSESASPASCNPNSTVGNLTITTPDLPKPLKGAVFLGGPLCNPCSPEDAQSGRMVRLYLQAIGEGNNGITVKLAGTGSIDQGTGRLTTVFAEDPQLPFESVKFEMHGGPRATFANPRTCGLAVSEADLTPWSTPFVIDSTPSSAFEVTGCTPPQFAPSFTAGTTSNQAGGFSPFTLVFGRSDADQFFAGVKLRMPPGLLGMISSLTPCPEPQAAQGSCGPESLIGTTQALTGPGANPFLVSGGKVFITAPYKGAPYGLSIVFPAKAGPYTLSGTTGEGTVVVRAAIGVDPATAQLTVTADPLPTVLDGIPLQLRVVNVTIDRHDFTFNPTNCDPLSIAATLTSTLGSSAQVSAPFQVTNCAALGFKPKLALKLRGPTKRGAHPALTATLHARPGDANIGRAAVTLPRSEFLDQGHIKTVCTRVQFNEGAGNGEGCPAGSVYGYARATTPILSEPLQGPVYLRSSEHQLPDLVAALHSGGINIDLDGRIDSVHGGIRNSFEAVPDAPVSSFTLSMQGAGKGLLVNSTDLCAKPNRADAKFTAHNGKTEEIHPALKSSCGAHAKHRRHGKRAGLNHRRAAH